MHAPVRGPRTTPLFYTAEQMRYTFLNAATWLLVAGLDILGGQVAEAKTYTVSSDDSSSLSEALEDAGGGDTIFLEDGTYKKPIVTRRSGSSDDPLLIVGGRDAIINAGNSGRAVTVKHSYINLEGFTVDARVGADDDDIDSYISKGVYVTGGGEGSPVRGFVMRDLLVKNCGAECVRLKNNVVGAEITSSTVQNCGYYYYEFGEGIKNGEGIYIGTSATQWSDDDSPDTCRDNVVSDNKIITNGNECVDIKEGSSGNTVEDNECSNQRDSVSAGFNIRGNDNTISGNTVSDSAGFGVRLGGWKIDGEQYGTGNDVMNNKFENTGGSFNIRVTPQGDICGNSCEDGDCDIEYNWEYSSEVNDIRDKWDQSC